MFAIMLSLGLREGECAGLKREDIDLEKMELHVRRSLQWSKLPGEEQGRWIERPPKQKSYRDLPITDTIRANVVRHLARRKREASTTKGWRDSGYLFTSVTGAPLHPRNILSAFHALCDAAAIPRIRVHDCRHSCATLLHAQGADGFTIQQVLGHSQISTTRRYTHVKPEVIKPVIVAVDSALSDLKRKRQEEALKKAAATSIETAKPQSGMIQ